MDFLAFYEALGTFGGGGTGLCSVDTPDCGLNIDYPKTPSAGIEDECE
jgi:hypothetical protein